MQTSVLYDWRSSATPSQIREAKLRHARAERIKSLARVDRPVICLSASQRSRAINNEPGASVDYSTMWFYDLVKAGEGTRLPKIEGKTRIDQIQMACAKHFGVTRSDILSARKTAKVVRPRHIAYYLSKVLTLKSLPEIGRRFSNRDHTSILHGIRKIERLRQADAEVEADVTAILLALGGAID